MLGNNLSNDFCKLVAEIDISSIEIFKSYEHYSQWKKHLFGKYDLWLFQMHELRTAAKFVRHIKRALRTTDVVRDMLHRCTILSLRENHFGTTFDELTNNRVIKHSAINPMCELILMGCNDKTPYDRQEYADKNPCDFALQKYVQLLKVAEEVEKNDTTRKT